MTYQISQSVFFGKLLWNVSGPILQVGLSMWSLGMLNDSTLSPMKVGLWVDLISINPLGHAISKHVSFLYCADEAHLHMRLDQTSSVLPSAFTSCLGEIEMWMSKNLLQLNSTKTETLLICMLNQL